MHYSRFAGSIVLMDAYGDPIDDFRQGISGSEFETGSDLILPKYFSLFHAKLLEKIKIFFKTQVFKGSKDTLILYMLINNIFLCNLCHLYSFRKPLILNYNSKQK